MENGHFPRLISNVGKKICNRVMRHRIDDEKVGILGINKVTTIHGVINIGNQNTLSALLKIQFKGITMEVNKVILQLSETIYIHINRKSPLHVHNIQNIT